MNLGGKWRKARRELNAIDIQLINNYNLQQAKKDNREVI